MTQWMQQSFFFDWNDPSLPTPVPITAQCENLQIKWSRGTATGPDPVAPYYLQIYTSHYVFPFLVPAGSGLSTNFTVPFAPGTQYQICMFDSVGNTGGCQAVYTVYAPSTTQSMAGQCANFSFPATTLAVSSSAGQYAWVPSCTDLTLKPTSGTPPYEVTIAPALHPPYNITNVGSEGTTWKVALQWAVPFFISMSDSSGLSWSFGPLHAGQGSNDCLADSTSKVSIGATVGGVIGALIVGAVLALVVSHFLAKKKKDDDSVSALRPIRGGDSSLHPTPYTESGSGETSAPLMGDEMGYTGRRTGTDASGKSWKGYGTGAQLTGYRVEPFDPNAPQNSPLPPVIPSASESSNPRHSSQQIYVVHHDQGPAPVSIFTQDGTEVVELPPMYAGGSSAQSPPTGSVTSPSEISSATSTRPSGTLASGFIPPAGSGRTIGSTGRPEKPGSSPRPLPHSPP
ncbi:hypothetical protein FRB99_003172 [Tulasnella sp. 403]|nr:hypothetical protein FRB99_003172 [Tulasnella sp. 403]